MKFSQLSFCVLGGCLLIAQATQANESASSQTSIIKIPTLNEVERPITSAKQLLVQNSAQAAQITSIQLNKTTAGLEVVISTADNAPLQASVKTEENTVIADVPNAVLALSDGKVFRSSNPTPDITSITATQIDATTVRVTITGKTGAPIADLKSGAGLTIAVTLDDEQEEEVTVTGGLAPSYRVPNASTATGTDTPILETPFSVQVIPQQVIRDQQSIQIKDALSNVSGVAYAGDLQGRSGNKFTLRGFSDADVLQDGVRKFGDKQIQGAAEIANLEQIEVLKGPASILFGAIEPGGLINLVSKQPLSEPFQEVEVQTSSRGLLRPRFDFSGPLDKNRKVLYRLNGLLQTQDNFRNFDQNDEKFLIAPALTLNISDQTVLKLSAEYVKTNRPADFGVPSKDGKVVDVPIDRVINEPSDTVEASSLRVGYKLEHQFNKQWKLNNLFRYAYTDYEFGVVAIPLSFDPETNLAFRVPATQSGKARNYTFQTSVVGEFSTGKIDHKLLAGVDYINGYRQNFTRIDFTPSFLDVFNPEYTLIKPAKSALEPFGGDETTANNWVFSCKTNFRSVKS